MGNSVYRWFAFPIERPKLPMLRAWYDRIAGQPGFEEHIAKPLV
jgi:glutathione S-transferase